MVNDFFNNISISLFDLTKLYMPSLDYLTKELELDINVNFDNNGKWINK